MCFIDRDRQRGLVGEDIVGRRVADQHDRHAGLVGWPAPWPASTTTIRKRPHASPDADEGARREVGDAHGDDQYAVAIFDEAGIPVDAGRRLGVEHASANETLAAGTVDEAQCEKLSLIRNTASEMGAPLFINARTDVYLKANDLSDEEKLAETIRRGKAYKNSGADCFYPIFLKEETAMEKYSERSWFACKYIIASGNTGF